MTLGRVIHGTSGSLRGGQCYRSRITLGRVIHGTSGAFRDSMDAKVFLVQRPSKHGECCQSATSVVQKGFYPGLYSYRAWRPSRHPVCKAIVNRDKIGDHTCPGVSPWADLPRSFRAFGTPTQKVCSRNRRSYRNGHELQADLVSNADVNHYRAFSGSFISPPYLKGARGQALTGREVVSRIAGQPGSHT